MGTVEAGSVGDEGEAGLVDRLVALLPARDNDQVLVGPGDDAAVVLAPDGRVVVTTDVVVEGRHFRRDWSSPEDIGGRAAAQNLADIAAMGARPTALVVALALPPQTPTRWVEELMAGLVAESAKAGAAVVGGDVVRGDVVTVSVTALGSLDGRDAVLRSGARAGDVVAVAGRLGWAAAGLAVLSRGFRSPRALVDAHRRPHPPYALGSAAAVAGARAMIDVSDGLLLDAGRVAAASAVSIDIDTALLPVGEPVASAAAAYNHDPLIWVLGGGEDHALLAMFPAGTALPEGFTVIGEVGEGEPGLVLVDGLVSDIPPGFDHFRS